MNSSNKQRSIPKNLHQAAYTLFAINLKTKKERKKIKRCFS